jgi:hypothetical protein
MEISDVVTLSFCDILIIDMLGYFNICMYILSFDLLFALVAILIQLKPPG